MRLSTLRVALRMWMVQLMFGNRFAGLADWSCHAAQCSRPALSTGGPMTLHMHERGFFVWEFNVSFAPPVQLEYHH